MSHDHTTTLNPTGAEPVVGTPPPRPPSDWLEPTTEPGEGPGEFVVIEDEDAGEPAPPPTPDRPLSGPRSRPHLPYGQGWRKRPDAKPVPPTQPVVDKQSGEVRLKILDTWMRSGLPAGDFAPLVNVSKHTLYSWKQRFEEEGPAGLMDRPRGMGRGSRLPEITKRAILLMKQMHKDWGVDRLSDMLLRTQALQASPQAVAKVLAEDGYIVEHAPMHRHEREIRHFERAKPNQLWQTDLFPFVLKRQNQRVYLVGFMDDHSRFITAYGLHTSQSAALVIETLRAGIGAYKAPDEVLTDNGSQYITWRGTSQFQQECTKRGIKQIVSSPRHPQTLGKIERFWGALWRECVDAAVFVDLADARLRIGHYIDYYNFHRPHQGINGMAPAERFFGAALAILESQKQRVKENALDLARHGVPKTPLYLAGNVGGTPVVLHSEGDRVFVSKDGTRAEVNFDPRPVQTMPSPAAVGADVGAVSEAMPAPAAPSAQVPSAWTGAEEQLPGASALDGDALHAPVGGA